MDGSCIDESTTSDSISTSLPALSALPATKSPESLCRVGSGTSVILDSESRRSCQGLRHRGAEVPWPRRAKLRVGREWEEEPSRRPHDSIRTGTTSKGVLLNFEDMGGKVWRFRYSYWNSSQSYVLTKGWSRFVKEKNLKAGDIVSFQRSTGGDKQLYIDWKARNGPTNQINPVEPVEMVRLFGVNIFKVPVNSSVVVANNGSWTGKRMIEMELLSFECSKKQRVIGAV
ncbi:unnamed protein product, partial [Vitis vinifera]